MSSLKECLELKFFMRQTRDFLASREKLRAQDFRAGFDRMLGAHSLMLSQDEELQRVAAPGFNLFKLLRVQRNEVLTHSAVLADLLDPRGSHGQGTLFLKTFLRIPCLGMADTHTELGSWSVQTEKPTFVGTLDIFLSAPKPIRQCLIVENKIDAGDQRGQLARYYYWLTCRKDLYEMGKSKLVYLTVDGRPPSSHSLLHHEGNNVLAAGQIVLMSYHKDIYSWLSGCIRLVKAPRVQIYLEQYLEIVQQL